MSTVDHGHRHVWTGANPRQVRCVYLFCRARPTSADLDRQRAQAETMPRLGRVLQGSPDVR